MVNPFSSGACPPRRRSAALPTRGGPTYLHGIPFIPFRGGGPAPSATGRIIVSSGTTVNLFKNKIYDLSGSTAGTIVNGLNLTGGTTLNVSNNLIGDLRATAANGTNAINGINANAASTFNIFHNTIYLSATSTSVTTFGNSCITFREYRDDAKSSQ